MTENPLISVLGDLTKPATVLVEKVSDAVGGIFKPHQIIRVAKAEAEADRIQAESQIQVVDIEKRAMRRFLVEEARNQLNMEEITKLALPKLDEDSNPGDIEDDWITNFFDKCRIVSDTEMQQLWSGVLAGEANEPGAFSRQTVNLLADLDKTDAELFTRLCGFCWKIGVVDPLVYEHDVGAEIYDRQGVNFNSLSHLESLGLIHFDPVATFQRVRIPKKFSVFYYGKPVSLTFPNDEDNTLILGHVLLTRAGHQLAEICGSRPVEDFWDYVKDRWTKQSLLPEREVAEDAPKDG